MVVIIPASLAIHYDYDRQGCQDGSNNWVFQKEKS